MISKSQVLAVLARHIGEDRGVHIEHLVAELLGSSERDSNAERRVRALVSELREEGTAICAHPSVGYFTAANEYELQRFYFDFLESRALKSLFLISRVKKIALPDLLGQLKLRT